MEIKKCVYCGNDADTKDHVIPLSFYYDKARKHQLHLTDEYGKENIVDCCRECNCIASNNVFDDIYKKKEYIQEQLKKRYRKIVNMPYWSEKQIDEMGKTLAKEIRIQQMARNWAINRINYPIELYPETQLNKDIREFLTKYF